MELQEESLKEGLASCRKLTNVFFSFLFFLYVHEHMCTHVCVCNFVSISAHACADAYRGRKRVPDPLQLELLAFMN